MSRGLEEIVNKLPELSFEELLELQTEIIQYLRVSQATKSSPGTTPYRRVEGFYRASEEEVEAELSAILTPEELAETKNNKFDTSKLPPLPRSLTDIISEDREDRF